MARRLYHLEKDNLLAAVAQTRNGARLMAQPALREDVPFCLRRDVVSLVAEMGKEDGLVKVQGPDPSWPAH